MPNWCSVIYACITKDEKEAKKLYNAIYSMDKSRNPLAESDFGKLHVEQDKGFKACKLAEIEDDELQSFLSRMYDKD